MWIGQGVHRFEPEPWLTARYICLCLHFSGPEGDAAPAEVLNERAVAVIARVSNKLTGRDFDNEVLDVNAQVRRLIRQATSHENLCQCYIGWCPFW